jgi:thioredoxin 1
VVLVENLSQIDKLVKEENKLMVIDFSAEWCSPCKMIAPIFSDMSATEKYANIIFVKVDVDKAPDVAQKYKVMSMPTFVFVRKGAVVHRFSGANVELLRSTIDKFQQ